MKQRKRATAAALFLSLCLFALSLSGCGLYDGLLSTAIPTDYPFSESYSVGDATLEGGADRIFLTWLYGTVHIRTHREDRIEIRETANLAVKEDYTVHFWHRSEGDETVLNIAYSASGIKDFGTLEKDLILLLPESAIASLTVTVDSADVTVELPEGTPVGSFLLSSFTGEVDVSLANGNEVSLSAHCHASAPKGKDTVRFASTGRIGDLSITSTYSAMDVSVKDADTVKLTGAEGDIFLRGNVVGASEISTTFGKTQIYLQGYDTIRAESGTGDVTMTLPAALGFNLKISSAPYGDGPKSVAVNFDGATEREGGYTVGNGEKSIDVATDGRIEVTPFES